MFCCLRPYLGAPDVKGEREAGAITDFSGKKLGVWIILQAVRAFSAYMERRATDNCMAIDANDKVEPWLNGQLSIGVA